MSMCIISLLTSCGVGTGTRYGEDLELLKLKTAVVELVANEGRARVMVVPEYQGRVITSTFSGELGVSNGWVNRAALDEDNVTGGKVGGEDRLWIGPLGSQFSFFFQQIEPISDDNWLVPVSMNHEPYEVLASDSKSIRMRKEMQLTNFVGTEFELEVFRTVSIFDEERVKRELGVELADGVDFAAYESAHELFNRGEKAWSKETGLAGLWSAGMFEGSDDGVMVIPLRRVATLDEILQYLGPLDESRLRLLGRVLLFKVDGRYRSKIGVPRELAPDLYASYLPSKKRLTINQYKQTDDSLYFNSEVSVQENPYYGEVIPIYNHGTKDYSPTDTTAFFEMESVAPMLELKPGESKTHFHRIYHFSGNEEELTKIAEELLGVDLTECSF
ncbi:DUF6786 family protein [Pelagicoccus mobilis]|uniref:Uncharacterized protein n=1 Tax=Pelagicoccus mobilis TaxID=415221 RepID=A0A934RYU5_9BACT|nr:DUF6786 family protein [Pelagicoccus mobilis]MBK1880225.1 hypothetical protein [Pelagicoccus mobilis]